MNLEIGFLYYLFHGRYDAVSYLKYLDTLRVSESFRSVWIFAESSYKIFDYARKRVYCFSRSDGTKINKPSKNVSGKKRKLKEDGSINEGGECIHSAVCVIWVLL